MVDGNAVALWAPNSPVWIAAALGVLAAGGMLVPIDDLADAEQLEAALNSSGARLILTTARHLDASGAILRAHRCHCDSYRRRWALRPGATAWQALANKRAEDLPVPANDEPAMLSWTSGTTGSPKAFMLTHRNIASNVEALQKLAVVGPGDRALLPLPLHHAYPFVVGMLTTLSLGTTIVLPGGTTGSALMRALREANVTTIIGVPRLYEALWTAIEARLKGYHLMVRLVFGALLKVTIFVQQSSGTSSRTFSVRARSARSWRRACDCWSLAEHGWRRRPRNSWKLLAGRCCPDMDWRKPPHCSPAIARTTVVLAALGARSPPAKSESHTQTIRGSARSSCVEARSPKATSTIPRPIR